MGDIKQVILIRRDLKMRRGKEIAQGSHASMKFLCDKLRKMQSWSIKVVSADTLENCQYLHLTEVEKEWINGSFAKVCLQVSSEEELLAIHHKALDAGLTSCLIQDSGKTEFHGTPTHTCIAIGPDYSEKIDPITGHLSLY